MAQPVNVFCVIYTHLTGYFETNCEDICGLKRQSIIPEEEALQFIPQERPFKPLISSPESRGYGWILSNVDFCPLGVKQRPATHFTGHVPAIKV